MQNVYNSGPVLEALKAAGTATLAAVADGETERTVGNRLAFWHCHETCQS
jgi:hypothetical protein